MVRRGVNCSVEPQVWRLLETAIMHNRADDSGLAGGPSESAGISSKALASLSCLVLLITALYYSLAEEFVPGGRLWQQQSTILFVQISLVTSAYWYVHRLLRTERAKALSRLQDPPYLPALARLLLVVYDRPLRHRCS